MSTQTCGTDEAEGDKVDIPTAEARIVASCVAVITLRHNFACEIPVTSCINYKVLFPDQQLGKLVYGGYVLNLMFSASPIAVSKNSLFVYNFLIIL